MEEKLNLILAKLEDLENRLIYCENLLRKINKDTEGSLKNNTREVMLNTLGDIIGNVLIPERIG